jgi:hypothetical protein
MISHADLADIAGTVYRGAWSGTVASDVHYALLPRESGVSLAPPRRESEDSAALPRQASELVVALPGTHPQDALDWLRDVRAWPSWVGGLGLVHSGFGKGARAAWARMAPEIGGHDLLTFTGHSLGGALAACLAALCAYDRPGQAFRLVTFGQPRIAFANPNVGRLIARGIEVAMYRRLWDCVPEVPAWPYLRGGPQTRIGATTGDWIEDHSIARYAADLREAGL